VPTPRTCVHCKKEIPLEIGFIVDEKFNVKCGYCKKLIFTTEEFKEDKTRKYQYNYNHTPCGYCD
jgi:hypothetical protein